MGLDVQKYMNEDLPALMAKFPDQMKAIGSKFQLHITGEGGGSWYIDVSESGPRLEKGRGNYDAELTVTIAADDFEKLQENPRANGMQLLFAGRLKFSGNQMLVNNFAKLFTIGET